MQPKQKVIELCQFIDELVSADPGASELGVMETLRFEMIDALARGDLDKALYITEIISLRHAGNNQAADFLETGRKHVSQNYISPARCSAV